jgi:L-amino acid N-acyltransferase
MQIRDADLKDAAAIAELNNALILSTTITWNETIDSVEQRKMWLANQQKKDFPVLVADEGSLVVGFASYEHFRGEGRWPGYRTTAEHSIHIQQSYWGKGIGRALLEALMLRAREAGIHVLVAGIDSQNEASIRFHQHLGFVEVARMPEVGQKFGRWLDLVLMQRILDDRRVP